MRRQLVLGFATANKLELGKIIYFGRDADAAKTAQEDSKLYRFQFFQVDNFLFQKFKEENLDEKQSKALDDQEDERAAAKIAADKSSSDQKDADRIAANKARAEERAASKKGSEGKAPAKKAPKKVVAKKSAKKVAKKKVTKKRTKKGDTDLLS